MSVKLSTMVESIICPLCGGSNLCLSALNHGVEKGSCWCQNIDVTIPQALLALIPLDKKGISCVCEACVKAFPIEPQDENR